MESPVQRKAYNIKEVAAQLGVSTVSIRRAVARGLIKPMRHFRHLLFSVEEIERFVASGVNRPKRGAG